jgi:hypothetical protein
MLQIIFSKACLRASLLLVNLLFITNGLFAQACPCSHISVSIINATLTAPNKVEFDLALKNTGVSTLSLAAIPGGMVYNVAALNGGSITGMASKLPFVTPLNNLNTSGALTVQTATNQIRWSHTPISGTSVLLSGPGVSAIAHPAFHFTLTNSVPFSTCTPLNLTMNYGLSSAYSNSVAYVSCNGNANNMALSSFNNALEIINYGPMYFPTSCPIPCQSIVKTSIYPDCLLGANNGYASIQLQNGNSVGGYYSLNGGANSLYTSNPIQLNGLAPGTYTVLINDTFTTLACSPLLDTFTIGTCNLSTVTTVTACGSFLWSVNNVTYYASGNYVAANNIASCTQNNILNLAIIPSGIPQIQTVTACNLYQWNVTGQNFTSGGVYTTVSNCGIIL